MTTEQTNTESAPIEGAGTPSPVSPASGQPSSAEAAGEVSNQELAKRLEKLERMEQSAKDRAIANMQKQLDELSGKSVAEVKTEAAVATPGTGTINGAQAIPEALARLSEVGLSVSDPEFAALIGKAPEYKSREAFLLDVERAVTRKAIKPQVSAAAAVTGSTPPPPPANVQELTQEYIQKVIDNRGSKVVIQQLKADYAKKGVDVNKVAFTIK